ncbi:MAG TPA: ABC transporter substrate-binding protein [Ilumatobacter sp.]|nr:ABC transporter substrate-binding protein [Ilumatobacter sp.]
MYRKFLSVLLLGAVALAAACGGDDDTSASDPTVAATGSTTGATTQAPGPTTDAPVEPVDTTTPATTGDAPGDDVPRAIISLSPTATEMLYALDAGDQVLAVDDFSNYPPEAAGKMVGLNAFQPSLEAIAGLEPDLVIVQGGYDDLVDQLADLGIDTFVGAAPVTLDEVYTQIEQLGARVGRVGEAAELVLDVSTRVDAAIAGLPVLDQPLTYYHELDPTYFSVTSDTFIGAVYAELGLINIADAGADNPYPQLSAEYIIDANPDLIFLACTKYCGETAETVAARPGWDTIAAVANGGVIGMDDDIASRWGPRIADYIEQAGAAVGAVAALQPAP